MKNKCIKYVAIWNLEKRNVSCNSDSARLLVADEQRELERRQVR